LKQDWLLIGLRSKPYLDKRVFFPGKSVPPPINGDFIQEQTVVTEREMMGKPWFIHHRLHNHDGESIIHWIYKISWVVDLTKDNIYIYGYGIGCVLASMGFSNIMKWDW